jgi:general stress protein 26
MAAAAALIGLAIPGCGTAQNLSRDSLELVAREVMEAADYAALITLDAEGHPRARVMDPFPPEDDMSVWLATNPLSRKVEQIQADDRVTLYYFDDVGLGYVTLMGTARLVDDPEEKARRWKPGWEAFYPDRDSSYLLIQVRPHRMEVISVKHGLDGDPDTWTPPGFETR